MFKKVRMMIFYPYLRQEIKNFQNLKLSGIFKVLFKPSQFLLRKVEFHFYPKLLKISSKG